MHNGVDTNNTTFIDAQNAVLRHLHSHGVTCPTPLESVDGSWTAYVDVAGTVCFIFINSILAVTLGVLVYIYDICETMKSYYLKYHI